MIVFPYSDKGIVTHCYITSRGVFMQEASQKSARFSALPEAFMYSVASKKWSLALQQSILLRLSCRLTIQNALSKFAFVD